MAKRQHTASKGASSPMAKRRRKGGHMNPTATTATTTDAATELLKLDSAFSKVIPPKDADMDVDAKTFAEFMRLADLLGHRMPSFLAVMKRMFAMLQGEMKRRLATLYAENRVASVEMEKMLQAGKRVASVEMENEGDIESPPDEQVEDRAVRIARAERADAASVRAQQKAAQQKAAEGARLTRYNEIIDEIHGTLCHPVKDWFSGLVQKVDLNIEIVILSLLVGNLVSETKEMEKRSHISTATCFWDAIGYIVMYRQFHRKTTSAEDKLLRKRERAEHDHMVTNSRHLQCKSGVRTYMNGFHRLSKALGAGFLLIIGQPQYFDPIRKHMRTTLNAKALTVFEALAPKALDLVCEEDGWTAPHRAFDDVVERIIGARVAMDNDAFREALSDLHRLTSKKNHPKHAGSGRDGNKNGAQGGNKSVDDSDKSGQSDIDQREGSMESGEIYDSDGGDIDQRDGSAESGEIYDSDGGA
ncbi:hypothetical protein HDU86_005572 [Geranomyces michiganensis]|nr:hypothetical protein HDU86_005572 [Geranomyces michiganensis]